MLVMVTQDYDIWLHKVAHDYTRYRKEGCQANNKQRNDYSFPPLHVSSQLRKNRSVAITPF